MDLEIEFGSALCYTRRFTINGLAASTEEFGEQYDRDPENVGEEGVCGDMQFTRLPPADEVLAKYGISPAEYEIIAAQLENGLSFGCCSLCW